MARWGTFLGTRSLGSKVRAELERLIEQTGLHTIVVDFDSVETITHSFAAACFGTLVRNYGWERLREQIVFRDTNAEVEAVLKYVIISAMKWLETA